MFCASHWHGDGCNSWFPNDRVKWKWFRQSTFRSVKRKHLCVVSHWGYRANWMDSGKKSHKYLIYSKLAFWSIRFITYLIYSEKFSSLFGLRMRMNPGDESPKPSKPLTEILGILLHVFTAYLSNTPTNLCMALLTFSLFCFVLYCYAFVQYCNVNTIQYNAMHKFVKVLDNPLLLPYIYQRILINKILYHSVPELFCWCSLYLL